MINRDHTKTSIAYINNFFRVEHCRDCFIAGYLIIFPHVPILSLAELSKEALQNLSTTIALSHTVITEVISLHAFIPYPLVN